LSVGWAALAGAGAILAGLAAGALALVGFGADSITDGAASAVLVWRFRRELAGDPDVDRIERRAARAVGTILIAIAGYVGIGAVVELAGHTGPSSTPAGVALAASSLVVLPALGASKLRLAVKLGSGALRADAVLSLAGAALAGVTLVSLALEGALGWWWSDAVAAIMIATFLLAEGGRTLTRATWSTRVSPGASPPAPPADRPRRRP
jgi:divalent metal cation (Fe/Co/Zn/Cd) transporter